MKIEQLNRKNPTAPSGEKSSVILLLKKRDFMDIIINLFLKLCLHRENIIFLMVKKTLWTEMFTKSKKKCLYVFVGQINI